MPGTADDVPIPALLRASRGAYHHAIAQGLVEAGCPPLPRGGVFVVAALANRNLQPGDVVGQVARGERRRQLLDKLSDAGFIRPVAKGWEATELGTRAGAAIASAIAGVDSRLDEQVGNDGITALRRGLVALCDIRDTYESSP